MISKQTDGYKGIIAVVYILALVGSRNPSQVLVSVLKMHILAIIPYYHGYFRVYCSGQHSIERLSSQLTQYHILESLMHCLAPIMPHLMEEVYMHCPYHKGKNTYPIFKFTLGCIFITNMLHLSNI